MLNNKLIIILFELLNSYIPRETNANQQEKKAEKRKPNEFNRAKS